MKMTHLVMVITFMATLSQTSQLMAGDKHEDDLVCQSAADCAAKWERAEQWVRQNSHWDIQTANDMVIQTERQSGYGYSNLVYKISKETEDGKTAIHFYADCMPSVSCSPSVGKAKASFMEFVNNR